MPKVVKMGLLVFWKSNLMQNFKKMNGGPLEKMNFFQKNENLEQSNSVEKCKRDP